MYETDAGSMSLSCGMGQVCEGAETETGSTYGDLLLRDDHSAVLSPDADRGDVGGGNGFESIFSEAISRLKHAWSRIA